MLRSLILAAARNDTIKSVVAKAPISRDVVRRFVAGESTAEAVAVSKTLADRGLAVTLDYLGEDTTDKSQADATVQQYLDVLTALNTAGLTPAAEVSVKLSAIGQAIDEQMAYDNATTICAAAKAAGTTVTLDMEDHTTTDSTLGVLARLRTDYPTTGAVLQSYLKRTEQDCRDLATAGSRVRLCKGAYNEPESVAYQDKDDVDRSYVRCMNLLLSGEGYPMFATHDPRLIAIAQERSAWHGRDKNTFEMQMLYGIRPLEQDRLAAAGNTMRIYLPYGEQWYGYLMRRLAERPSNVTFFLRSFATKS